MAQMMALFPTAGPRQALREASPQALHHFTRFDSVGRSGRRSFDRDVQLLRGRKGKVEFLKPYNMSVDILH